MTAKLKLKCLATDRPAPSDTALLTFSERTGRLIGIGTKKASDNWVQVTESGDVARFYLKAHDVPTFLCDHDLVELPEKPNPEREAYSKALAAWYASSLNGTTSGPAYTHTKKLFISHELLKAGYTISEGLYIAYC